MFSLQNVFVGSEGVRMAFSPNESRQSGGGLLVLAFSDDTPLRADAEFFVSFEGKSWRHLVTTKRVNNVTFHSHIPEHKEAEVVRLSILSSREGSTKALATSSFRYNGDLLQSFGDFLMNSVFDATALENTERLKAEYKEVFREDIQAVDRKLCCHVAQQSSRRPEGWNLLAANSGKNVPEPQETLLHLCARLGLRWTAQYLLGQPGGAQAQDLPNIQDDTPTDVSNMYGNIDMAEMFSGRTPNWGDPPWHDLPSTDSGAPPTRIRRVDRDQFVLSTNISHATTTLYDDLALIQEVVISRRFAPLQHSFSSPKSTEGRSNASRRHSGQRVRSKSEGVVMQDTTLSEDSDAEDSPFHGDSNHGNRPQHHQHHHHHQHHRYARSSHPSYHKPPPPPAQPHKKPLHNYPVSQNTSPSFVAMDTSQQSLEVANNVVSMDTTSSGYVTLEPSLSTSYLHRLSPSVTGGGGSGSALDFSRNSSGSESWNKPVLEESLKKLQEIHTTLQQKLRVTPEYGNVGGSGRESKEDDRKENLNRFSTSCPSLPDTSLTVVQSDTSTILTNQEADHHKSLSNLIATATQPWSGMPDGGAVQNRNTSHTNYHNATSNSQLPHNSSHDPTTSAANMNASSWGGEVVTSSPHQVKIYINDVTVDATSDDFTVPPQTKSAVSDSNRHNGEDSSSDLIEQIKRANRRRSSWCPEEGRKKEEKQEKQKMLNVSGRSQSLSSLDGDSDDDDDDDDSNSQSSSSYHDIQTDSSPGGRYSGSPCGDLHGGSMSTTHYSSSPRSDIHRQSVSPTHYSSSSHGRSMSPARYSSSLRQAQEVATYAVSSGLLSQSDIQDQSTSLAIRGESDRQVVPNAAIMSPGSSHHSPPRAAGRITPAEVPSSPTGDTTNNSIHGLMYTSALSKASSSPSIATGHQEQHHSSPPAGADFTESIKMTGAAPVEDSREDGEARAEWFRSQPAGMPLDVTDLSVAAEEEEERPKLMEKKRKTSVFAKLGSYRQKRVPNKDLKLLMNSHQFVSVSVSNATLCDVCGKSMANKAALQCENCIVNVHENACKDQISPCAKFRLTRNGDSVKDKSSSLPESVNLNTNNLKASQSFKERRSISVPARPVLQVSSSTSALPRSNSPSRVINEERDKVKEEEISATSMQLLDTTNITETLSVSLESLDEACTDVADIVEDYEPEPEAWSVTVDKKTLKKKKVPTATLR